MKLADTVKKCLEEGTHGSVLDFGIHGAMFDPSSQIQDIPKVIDLGVASFKMFMTYAEPGPYHSASNPAFESSVFPL
jgi:dihydroorotase-like cyclic amidohydrolase